MRDDSAAISRLTKQVTAIVARSGDPDLDLSAWDAHAWLHHYLDSRLPALGFAHPRTWLDSPEREAVVSGLIGQIESGAFA